MKTIPIEILKKYLTYEQDTGNLIWKERKLEDCITPRGYKVFKTRCAGRVAGGVIPIGYILVSIPDEHKVSQAFYAHRLAFALMKGRFPEYEIDHINGNRADNRWVNLREVTRVQNAANLISIGSNRKGVTQKKHGKWAAQISCLNQNVYLGTYDTETEAHAAFAGAAIIMRAGYANLTNRKKSIYS